eukprot:2935779-Rhodomonas_salina.5
MEGRGYERRGRGAVPGSKTHYRTRRIARGQNRRSGGCITQSVLVLQQMGHGVLKECSYTGCDMAYDTIVFHVICYVSVGVGERVGPRRSA